MFDFHVKNADFSRLLAWEALAFGADVLPGKERRQEYYAAKVGAVATVFPESNKKMIATLLTELIGLAVCPVLMSPLQRLLYGLPPGSLPPTNETREAVLRAAEALVDSRWA